MVELCGIKQKGTYIRKEVGNMGKWKNRSPLPPIYKDKARQKAICELNDEFTSDSKKNLLRTQLELYDKIMGYKK